MLGGHNINNLRYADDTSLLGLEAQKLHNLLTTVNDKGKPYGMEIKVKKTKLMVASCCSSINWWWWPHLWLTGLVCPHYYVRQCRLPFTLLVYVKLYDVSRGNFNVIYICSALSLHNCSSSGSVFFVTLRITKRYTVMTQTH